MSYHFTPTGALTDASQTASIAEIKTKTDKITITSNLNLNAISNETIANGTVNNTQTAQLAMTAASNMKTAIDLNTSKNSYPTADAAKVGKIIVSTSGSDVNLNTLVNFCTSRNKSP